MLPRRRQEPVTRISSLTYETHGRQPQPSYLRYLCKILGWYLIA